MKISAIVSDHSRFPSRLLYARLYSNNELKRVEDSFSTFHWDTRNMPSYWFPSENIEFPLKIDISYTSLTDGKTFEGGINVDCYANNDKIKEMANDGSAFLNIGLCANGVVAIWVQAINKSILVAYHSIEEVPAERGAVNSNKFQDKAMLPERNYFDKLMQQFCYRYLVLAERWDGERWLPPGWTKCVHGRFSTVFMVRTATQSVTLLFTSTPKVAAMSLRCSATGYRNRRCCRPMRLRC